MSGVPAADHPLASLLVEAGSILRDGVMMREPAPGQAARSREGRLKATDLPAARTLNAPSRKTDRFESVFPPHSIHEDAYANGRREAVTRAASSAELYGRSRPAKQMRMRGGPLRQVRPGAEPPRHASRDHADSLRRLKYNGAECCRQTDQQARRNAEDGPALSMRLRCEEGDPRLGSADAAIPKHAESARDGSTAVYKWSALAAASIRSRCASLVMKGI